MTKPLTNTQLAILQTFHFEMSEQELADFRQMFVDYFARKVSDDVDAL